MGTPNQIMNQGSTTVSVVIPAYNREILILPTLDSIRSQTLAPAEVLVIDDASRDATAVEARTAGATVLTQPHNQGYIAALKRGFATAQGEIVVVVDGDGEMPPDRIPALVAPNDSTPAILPDFGNLRFIR